jgi:hypothetical protein
MTRRSRLMGCLAALSFEVGWAGAQPTPAAPPTAEIKFADASAMLGNKPPKPKELGEQGSPDYLEWPFDVVFCDVNGDGRLDLFMMDHHGAPYSRLWLGDGKGHMAAVDPPKLAASNRRAAGCFSLLPYDFGGSGRQDVFNTYTTGQYHYTGPAGKNDPESFRWENSPAPGVWTIMLSDFNGDGFVDAAAGPNRGPGGQIHWGGGEALVKDFQRKTEAFVGFHSATADMNGDGWPDMVSSNFGQGEKEFYLGLLLNDGQGGFKDTAGEAGLDAAPAGGAVILADFNNDGLMDIYICGYPSTRKNEGAVKLYLNEGRGKFRDATVGSGLEGPQSCWQTRYVKTTAADFDNDGLIDIVIYGDKDYKLYQNLGGGKFKDVSASAGIATHYLGEPCSAAADYDDDGLVDLAMLSQGVWLGHNVSVTDNGWLKVRLIGPKGNPEAAGASVTLYEAGHLGDAKFILGHQQAQFSSDFHTSGSRLHFGLGRHPACDLTAVFPGGKTVERKDVKARARIEVNQP